MEEETNKPKRRIHYKGTHPKTFAAKYKEHQPEKYQATIEKIVSKGNTPAGMHRSICVQEIMDFLQIQPGQRGVDATFGYGGHSQEILKRLHPQGHLYALDVDPLELPKSEERLRSLGYDASILSTRLINFAHIDELFYEVGAFDFILADLGVSSMQIDNPSRGFSFRVDGPLDLRLNPLKGIPGSAYLKKMTQEEIEEMLIENADEPYAKAIAHILYLDNQKEPGIMTTFQLKSAIKNALGFLPKEGKEEIIKKTCQRTFQALRIEVNHELVALRDFLDKIPLCLASNGRVAILTFHSGEDRLVKKAFQQYYREGVFKEIALEAIRPSMEEQKANSRARSAKLRYGIKA